MIVCLNGLGAIRCNIIKSITSYTYNRTKTKLVALSLAAVPFFIYSGMPCTTGDAQGNDTHVYKTF